MTGKRTWTGILLFFILATTAPAAAWASYGYHGHHGFGHSRYGHYSGHGFYGHHGFGHHGYYGSYAYSYTPRYFYGPEGNPYRVAGNAAGLGALDLNVRPKRAQVYLNGNYIGNAGRFDGRPDYLWLKDGTYELALYLEGHATVVREITVQPGAVLDVEFRLPPGSATRPEQPAESPEA